MKKIRIRTEEKIIQFEEIQTEYQCFSFPTTNSNIDPDTEVVQIGCKTFKNTDPNSEGKNKWTYNFSEFIFWGLVGIKKNKYESVFPLDSKFEKNTDPDFES
mgnify:CR=1 FL=1